MSNRTNEEAGRDGKRRECDLYPPVRDWLLERGFVVHVEVFETDVIAVRGGELTAIELKLSSPDALSTQLSTRSQWADYVIGVMPHRPKYIGNFQSRGFGLLVVKDGKVRQIIEPRPQPDHWHKRHDYRAKKLGKREPAQPHEMAGLPSCPALVEQRQLRNKATDAGRDGET